jgi:hypothetical protein
MSEQRARFGVQDIPVDERYIGIDTLHQDDPAARAAYSSNPGFVKGAEETYDAADSILARPEIAEALEQIHLDRERKAATEFPVNPEVAIPGLQWLSEHFPKKSLQRRAANRQLGLLQGQRERRQEVASRNGIGQATSGAQPEKASKHEGQKALQDEADAQLRQVTDEVLESYPGINFSNFFDLADKLAPTKAPGGHVGVRTRKGFHAAVTERVEAGLDDPNKIISDMGVAILLARWVNKQGDSTALPHAHAHIDTIGDAMLRAMEGARYPDLDEMVLDRWFAAIQGTKPDAAEETSYIPRVTASGMPVETAQKVFANTGILENSFIALAEREPDRFIDRMHTLLYRSLEGDDVPVKFNASMQVVTNTLDNPMIGCVLTASSYYAQETAIQQKAVDILISLQNLGIPLSEVYPSGNVHKLSPKNKRTLFTIAPKAANGAIDPEKVGAVHAQDLFPPFEEYALAPEGRENTILGRLTEYAETTGVSLDPRPIVLEKLVKTMLDIEGVDVRVIGLGS